MAGIIGETIQTVFRNLVHDAESRAAREINYRINRYKRKFLKDVFALLFILISAIFLAVALTYFFIEYLKLTIAVSFLISGALFLIIAIIIKSIN